MVPVFSSAHPPAKSLTYPPIQSAGIHLLRIYDMMGAGITIGTKGITEMEKM